MKRDMDFIRELLLKIEGGQHCFNLLTQEIADIFEIADRETISRQEANKIHEHLRLLIQGKLVSSSLREGEYQFYVGDVTWLGHDFLDIYRDEPRWDAAKDAALSVGSVDFSTLMKIGKAMIKAKLQKSGRPIS